MPSFGKCDESKIHRFTLKERTPLPVSTPEEQGIPSAAVLHFLERIEKEDLEVDSLQVVRNGKLCVNMIGKPYHENSFHRIYSAAKGIVATAILFAVQEERLTLDTLVVPLLPKEWIPEDLDERWTRLNVYHLLTMTTGHEADTMFEMWKGDCWIRTFFEVKPEYEPGTYFRYDTGAQYVMNEIIHILTGQTTAEYLEERLFRHIGVEYTNMFTEPENLFYSSTIQLHPDGITRLALFYLNKGNWEGKQLLRKDLAELAGAHHGPSSHYNADPTQAGNYPGYALHMWRNRMGGFRFDGGQGQFGLVLPDENMAVGMLCCSGRANEILDIFFETIFADCYNHPIAADPYEQLMAKHAMEAYNLGPKNVIAVTDMAAQVNGKTYVLEPNPWGFEELTFTFDKDSVIVEEKTGNKMICGLRGVWQKGNTGYFLSGKKPEDISDLDHNFDYDVNDTMYTGGWRNETTFVSFMRSDSFLKDHRYTFTFVDDRVVVRLSYNLMQPRMKYRNHNLAPEFVLKGKQKG